MATGPRGASEVNARVVQAWPGETSGLFGGSPNIAVTPLLDFLVKDVKPALSILLAAVALLFAAAIGNVANMQLTRATARRREVAIRSAIGAGSGRLARQLIVETSTIAVMGGALGFGLTVALLRLLPALLPEGFPRVHEIAIDGRVLAAVSTLTIAVSLVISLLPARMARRLNVATALLEDGAAPVGQSLRSPAARSRALIITGQVAIAAVLLVGGALLTQSFVKLVTIDRGYQPANLLTARITCMCRNDAGLSYYRELLERLAATSGVTHVGLTNGLPLTPQEARINLGRDPDKGAMRATLRVVSPGYLAAMGMRIARGRGLTAEDVLSSEPVMLVNETFARQYLEGDPLDARLPIALDETRRTASPWRIVGVVADIRHRGAEEPAQPEVYAAVDQMSWAPTPTQYVTVRTTGDPAKFAATLGGLVRDAGRNAVLEQVMTMDTRLMRSLSKPRLYAVLIGAFSTFALLIAGIGLFGGLSYGVAQRTREIGVRTALGATPRDIVSLVVRQGTAMTAAGLIIGLGAAAATGRYLAGFLFGVSPLDPLSFSAGAGLLMVVAAVACAIPARRAARIDAIEALRQ